MAMVTPEEMQAIRDEQAAAAAKRHAEIYPDEKKEVATPRTPRKKKSIKKKK